jgi:excisionase family DNA binding protein
MICKSYEELPATLTMGEVAAVLRVHRRTVLRYERLGKLRGVRIGERRVRYCRDEVLKLLGVTLASAAA